jgi:hypothetical protein
LNTSIRQFDLNLKYVGNKPGYCYKKLARIHSPINSWVIMADKSNERTAIQRLAVPLSFYIVGAFVFFRWQIFSNFDLIFGDCGDGCLGTFILEHVYRWLHVRSGFLSPPFFFDQTKTLGYSEAFLLDQIIYAPLRLLGAEPLLAVSLMGVVLSALSFLFLYLFVRRLGMSVLIASVAALIFTFPNNLFLKAADGKLQDFTVYYIPIVAYCGLVAITDLHGRPFRSYLLGAFAAGLYGSLFSTGFYMAWYFGLALLIFTPIAIISSWPAVRDWWDKCPKHVVGLAVAASLSFFAALSVFVVIYAPVLATGATRTYRQYLGGAPSPKDIVNVGMDNLIWSKLIRSLHLIADKRLGQSGSAVALTPILQVLLLVSGILAFRPNFWPPNDIGRISRAIVIAGASVCALFFLLTIKYYNFSLFRVLYVVVPGANAIAEGYRGMLVANLFAVTAVGLTLDRIIQRSLQAPRYARLGRLAGLTALLSLVAIEQVNLAQPTDHTTSRKFEREHFSLLGAAPHECKSFYIADQARPEGIQIDAMMIALAQHIPTINGYSGNLPPGWDFLETKAPDYEQRAKLWALNRGITKGLCRVDVEKGTWSIVAVNRDAICAGGAVSTSACP